VTIEIRRIHADEFAPFVEAMSTAFLERPDVEKIAAQVSQVWELDRTWAAFDGGRLCGTFRTWATEQTVPGCGRLSASAVAGVSVLPTHRRRGILRRLVAAEHGASRERGEVVGLLYASEYPIYGRFGYGPAIREGVWSLDTHGSGFHAGGDDRLEIATPSAELATTMREVYEAWRVRQPGEIRRRDFRWAIDIGVEESAWSSRWKGFVVLHRDAAGNVDGYARYHAEDKWEQRQPRNLVHVDDLHALSDTAYASLWRFLADIDWAGVIRAERRSPSERLPWLLTNARAASLSESGDGMWARLFDVPRALEARTYERTASLVIEVVDDESADGRATFHLDASPDGATCRSTDRSPDLTVHVAALGAAYLGGTPLRHAVLVTGADEHRAGALEEADALLRTRDEPWASTFF
jgi:predicted acetyltransferase